MSLMRRINLIGSGEMFFVLLLVWVSTAISGAGEPEFNWPAWRGSHEDGAAEPGNYPQQLDPTNALWRAELSGKGCSTPIVWEKHLFLTAPTNNLDAVLAFDWDGKLEWLTAFGPQSPGSHRNGSGSNPSAVTDGKSIFVRFKSGTVAALDFSGKVRWQTNIVEGFGPEDLYWDQGTSPVLTSHDVVIARMHGGESWIAAFEKESGRLHWKIPRKFQTPTEDDHAYDTPLVIHNKSDEQVLVWGAQHLTTYAADTGVLMWTCDDFNPQSVPNWPAVASPVVARGIAIVACGRADRGQPRLYGIKLGGTGDVTASHRAWKREDTGTFVPTPAVADGKVYLVRDRGEVECLDPLTGKTIWKDAFPKSSHNFYASPLIASGCVYAAREDGVVFVARIKDGFELVSENKLGEQIIASPVPARNRIFLRGDRHLFCFGSN
jgi:outer membrane protein assembly factor BamB